MKRLYGYTALATLIAAPAWALTPQEAWDLLQEYNQRTGIELSAASAEADGDALVLTNLGMSHAQSAEDQAEVAIDVVIPEVRFVSTAEDTVVMTATDSYEGSVSITSPHEDEPLTLPLRLAHPGFEMTITGTREDAVIHTLAPNLTIDLEIDLSTETRSGQMPLSFAATDLDVRDHVTLGDMLRSRSEGSIGSVRVAGHAEDHPVEADAAPEKPETPADREEAKRAQQERDVQGPGRIDFAIDFGPIRGNADVTVQGDLSTMFTSGDMAAAVRAGMNMASQAEIQSMRITAEVDDINDGEPRRTTIAIGAEGMTAGLEMNESRAAYQLGIDSSDVRFESSDQEVVIAYTTGAVSTDIQAPMLAGPELQPFKIAQSMQDVMLGEDLWALISTGRDLPREPISFDMDITGDVLMERDLIDSEMQKLQLELSDPDLTDERRTEIMSEMMNMGPPGELRTVNVNQLALSALGADATASGALNFPEGGEISEPVGQINAEFNGVNQLLDRLVEAGVLEASDVMPMRMGLMMFARSVEGETDRMVTDLEFREDGSIFANGQQIQ
ncbi:MAG: DUF2125 domain-containing protein [Paracoccus sp. (in: a-proteobacteria)]|nr:DUF2125 domain-containing protein [Paracoccus sp. (in: a-proteobacteria)]